MSSTHHNITRCADLESLSHAAAAHFVQRSARAIADHGRFTVALAGGSTPSRMYELLAGPPYRDGVDWTRCFFFWSDDRVVPADHPDSNFKLANDYLLSRLDLRTEQVHRIPTDVGTAQEAACAYDVLLARFFAAAPSTWPRFDLVLLGMGVDGHVASLFPGAPALDVTDGLVVSSPPGALPPPVDRVTLTLPVLNAARAVAILIDGSEKAHALARALSGDTTVPAARVRPVDGELHWFVDDASYPTHLPDPGRSREAQGTPSPEPSARGSQDTPHQGRGAA